MLEIRKIHNFSLLTSDLEQIASWTVDPSGEFRARYVDESSLRTFIIKINEC